MSDEARIEERRLDDKQLGEPFIWGDTQAKRIAELESQVATLTAERDAARAVCRDFVRMFGRMFGPGTEGESLVDRAREAGFVNGRKD